MDASNFGWLEVRRREDVARFVGLISLVTAATVGVTAAAEWLIGLADASTLGPSLLVHLSIALGVAVPVSWKVGRDAAFAAEARDEALAAARWDDVTGLENGAAFAEAVARISGRSVLAFVQIDNFGELRRAGPRASARAAVQVADALREAVGADGRLFRTGPKRFAWLIPDGRTDIAFERLECARAALGRGTIADNALSSLTFSSGLSSGLDPEGLQIAAERALSRARTGGSNQIRIDYGPAADDDLVWAEAS